MWRRFQLNHNIGADASPARADLRPHVIAIGHPLLPVAPLMGAGVNE
jgi:hypothetical protein